MKRSLVMLSILALLAAPTSWSQGTKADPKDVAGTIASDSPEALGFFLDWVSVLGRVQAAFEDQGQDETPQEMGEWALKALRELKVHGNVIEFPTEGFEQPIARLFAEQVFHVFYEGPFREFCMDQIAERVEELESENERMQLEWMAELGPGGPEEIMGRLAQVREENFELRLNAAELEARVDALRKRIESQGPEREAQMIRQMDDGMALDSAEAMAREEVLRLQRQQEKLGTNDMSAIDEAQARLNQIQVKMGMLQMRLQRSQSQAGGGEELTHLRTMLIEAEADYAGLEIRSEAMAERQADLEKRAKVARDAIEERMNTDRELRQLERLMDRVENRGLFGARGIPLFQFR